MNLTEQIEQFEGVFARELTPKLAKDYVSSLVEALGGQDQSYGQLVARGVELHRYVGETLYGPLIAGCVQWMSQKYAEVGINGPIYFALRDAAPLQSAAQILWNGSVLIPVGIYANRPMLGVEDEIAPEKSAMNGKVLQYLGLMGLANMEKVAWVDTGAWGTVVKALKMGLLASQDFYPLFWYSHNLHIPGYLNDLLSQCGLPDKMGEILNDSLECVFPQPYLRPLELEDNSHGLRVKLSPSNDLSQVWGEAALAGIQAAAIKVFKAGGVSRIDQLAALKNLAALSEKNKQTGQWTGVLGSNTPTWSQGSKFIAEWPEHLLP